MTTLQRKDTMDDAEITQLAKQIMLDLDFRKLSTKVHARNDSEFSDSFFFNLDIEQHDEEKYNDFDEICSKKSSSSSYPAADTKNTNKANKKILGLCIDVSSAISPKQRNRNCQRKISSPIPDFSNHQNKENMHPKNNPFSKKHRKAKGKSASTLKCRVMQTKPSQITVQNGKSSNCQNEKQKAKSIENQKEDAVETEYGFVFVSSEDDK